jgi:hypothetical protein
MFSTLGEERQKPAGSGSMSSMAAAIKIPRPERSPITIAQTERVCIRLTISLTSAA